MEIILDHPYHGAMVVYSPAEAAKWGEKGWKIRAAKVAPIAAPEPEPEIVRVRKPRRVQ